VNYQKTHYLTSAVDEAGLPHDSGIEVAFIGRSNAGKSSAINTIVGLKGLARTSKTPGRTQMINYFAIDEDRHLVDLPGYGYAKVPRPIQERWTENINNYLKNRKSLRGLILVMDIRHPLQPSDEQLLQWALNYGVHVHVLLTKADKLTRQAMIKMLRDVQEALRPLNNVTCQAFSSQNRYGLDEAHELLEKWFTETAE